MSAPTITEAAQDACEAMWEFDKATLTALADREFVTELKERVFVARVKLEEARIRAAAVLRETEQEEA